MFQPCIIPPIPPGPVVPYMYLHICFMFYVPCLSVHIPPFLCLGYLPDWMFFFLLCCFVVGGTSTPPIQSLVPTLLRSTPFSPLSSNQKPPMSASRRWSVQTIHDCPVLSSLPSSVPPSLLPSPSPLFLPPPPLRFPSHRGISISDL